MAQQAAQSFPDRLEHAGGRPINIVAGNARVVRPRLADARFFFEQDKKRSSRPACRATGAVGLSQQARQPAQRVERLGAGRCDRCTAARRRPAKPRGAGQADLVTDMVGEFPELQGHHGTYYALADGEGEVVTDAIQGHYQPRFAGDALPAGNVAAAVALADKLDAWSASSVSAWCPPATRIRSRCAAPRPRRAAHPHGNATAARSGQLIDTAAAGFKPGLLTAEGFAAQLRDFMFERLKNLLRRAVTAP